MCLIPDFGKEIPKKYRTGPVGTIPALDIKALSDDCFRTFIQRQEQPVYVHSQTLSTCLQPSAYHCLQSTPGPV